MPLKYRQVNNLETIRNPIANEILSGGKTTSIESTFRYQINHCIKKDKIVSPHFGISSEVFYNFNKFNPATTSEYRKTEQNLGLLLEIIPSITFKINSKLIFDLNVPIGLYEIFLNSLKDENPQLTLKDQKRSKIVGNFIPKTIGFRIGLVYKI
jgi:hypothetical protein